MNARALALCLPLLALGTPLLSGCIITAHADRSDYGQAYEVVHLKNATAADVVMTLRQLGAGDPSADGRWGPVSVASDQRTNSILLRGPEARVDQIVEVVRELDVEQ